MCQINLRLDKRIFSVAVKKIFTPHARLIVSARFHGRVEITPGINSLLRNRKSAYSCHRGLSTAIVILNLLIIVI